MNINQVFKFFQKYGGTHAARIITDSKKNKKFSLVWVAWVILQLKRGVPIAKIIHSKWFYGLQFYTNKWTLDPRPDSETLIEAVINNEPNNIKILDMGTGSGCLIISIVKNISGAYGIGIDKSIHACAVARKNVKKFNLKNKIQIIRKKFNSTLSENTFDIIISNPPYIKIGDKNVNNGAHHDPKMSLYAKNNGLAAYEQIADSAKKLLKTGGKIYLEIGLGQAPDIRKIFELENWQFNKSFQDLAGIERILCFSL